MSICKFKNLPFTHPHIDFSMMERRQVWQTMDGKGKELNLEDSSQYKEMMRMSYQDFYTRQLSGTHTPCQLLGGHLTPPIRFLATEETYRSLSSSVAVIPYVVQEVCDTVARIGKMFLKVLLSVEERMAIVNKFEETWLHSNCVGAMDCKHVVFQPFKNSGKAWVSLAPQAPTHA